MSKCVQHEDAASVDNWSCRSSEKWAGIAQEFSACLEAYGLVGDLERVSRRSETWRPCSGEGNRMS